MRESAREWEMVGYEFVGSKLRSFKRDCVTVVCKVSWYSQPLLATCHIRLLALWAIGPVCDLSLVSNERSYIII